MMIYWLIVAVILLIVIYIISAINSINKLIIKVEEAFANIDIYLKKRYDIIPNLVETVKGYAKHEESIFSDIAKYRAEAMSGQSINDVENANRNLSAALNRIVFLKETYPQLKADTNFVNLQTSLKEIEQDLLNARKYYNGSVKLYNYKVVMIPSSIVAKMMNLSKKEYLTIDDTERKNVSVHF